MRVSFNFILFFFLWVTSDSSGLKKSKKKNKKKKEKTILVTIDNKIERRLLRYCEDAIKDSTKERTSLTVTSLLACIVIKEEEEEEMVAARATLRMRFYSRYYVYCIIVQKDRNKERERDMYVLICRTWCPWFNTFSALISKFSTFFFTIVNLDRSASIEQYSNKRGERVKS